MIEEAGLVSALWNSSLLLESDMNDHEDEATQKTPDGYEIPVPKRQTFMRNLEKTAKPKRRWLGLRRPKKK